MTAQISTASMQTVQPEANTAAPQGTAAQAPPADGADSFRSAMKTAMNQKAGETHGGKPGRKPSGGERTAQTAGDAAEGASAFPDPSMPAAILILAQDAAGKFQLPGLGGRDGTAQAQTAGDATAAIAATPASPTAANPFAQLTAAVQPGQTPDAQAVIGTPDFPAAQQTAAADPAPAQNAQTIPTQQTVVPATGLPQAAQNPISAQQAAAQSGDAIPEDPVLTGEGDGRIPTQTAATPSAAAPASQKPAAANPAQPNILPQDTTNAPAQAVQPSLPAAQAKENEVSHSENQAVGTLPAPQEKPAAKTEQPVFQTVGQAANTVTNGPVVIKVSDAPAKPTASAPKQVAMAAAEQLKQGKQEVQVDLYPQSLGKVSVKMTSENGTLTIELVASNPKTQSLLLSNSGEIRSALQSSTPQHVVVTEPQQAQPWYGQQDGGQQQQQQQQQEQQQAKQEIQLDGLGAGMPTNSFLSLLQQAASY